MNGKRETNVLLFVTKDLFWKKEKTLEKSYSVCKKKFFFKTVKDIERITQSTPRMRFLSHKKKRKMWRKNKKKNNDET